MRNITRSTASRQFSPLLHGLILAALRLKLHLEPAPRLFGRKK